MEEEHEHGQDEQESAAEDGDMEGEHEHGKDEQESAAEDNDVEKEHEHGQEAAELEPAAVEAASFVPAIAAHALDEAAAADGRAAAAPVPAPRAQAAVRACGRSNAGVPYTYPSDPFASAAHNPAVRVRKQSKSK